MTTTIPRPTTSARTDVPHHRGTLRRFFGVVARPQTYRNIAYLLLGLPVGTIWFAAFVSGWSVGISLLAVALVGIPVLMEDIAASPSAWLLVPFGVALTFPALHVINAVAKVCARWNSEWLAGDV